MNPALRAVLLTLLNKRIIGGRHTLEGRLIKSKLKWVTERKEFDKEYKKMINEGFIIRIKKRTGKGYDWHISLNPRKIKEVYERLEWK